MVATHETEKPKNNPTSKKWEYCAITGIVSIEKGFRSYIPAAVIRYFPNTSEQVEGTIAKLGDEGWEMVSVTDSFSLSEGSGRSYPVLYFKRAK
jgi:hypothetical protein